MNFFNRILGLFVVVSLGACQDDNTSSELPDLRIYLDRFEEEASKRGYNLNLSEVEAEYVDRVETPDDSFCGMGFSNYFNNNIRRIEISTDPSCGWATMNDIQRERLFFHEIGHAFLNRRHDEAQLCDGSPLSLMTTRIGNTYSESNEKRDYYISELVDRVAAADQCIRFPQTFRTNPIFYRAFEGDGNWFFYSDNDNYTGEAGTPANERFRFSIESNNKNTENTGYWHRTFSNPNFPECSDVTFRATINAEGLTGPGVAIVARAYHNPVSATGAELEEYLFLTSEDDPATGKFSNDTRELTIPCFSRKTSHIVIILVMLPGTTGEAEFTDVELIVNEEPS